MNIFLRTFTLCALLMLCIGAAAQSYVPYQWEENRKLYTASSAQEDLPLYVVRSLIKYQYGYDEGSGDFICYKTTHKIFKVNNDEALEYSNRIYIPMRSTIDIMAVKARAITPSGKVVVLDENNIKELEDDESGYRIFAIEGAEVGGEVEYYYTQKLNGSSFGVEYFQYNYPVNRFDFIVSTPENLEFDFNVVNDQGLVIQTDTTEEENVYEFTSVQIPALFEEDFSAYDASKKRIDFKLAYNSVSGNGRLYTWGDAGKRVYDQLAERDKSENKELAKFIKTVGLEGGDTWDKMLKAEHYIKTNFSVDEDSDADRLDVVLRNKYGSPRGFTRLYIGLAQELGLDYEIVVTCNRYTQRFDPEFDTWNYLDDFLIHFPGKDQYLSPDNFAFRMGTVAPSYLTNYGLYIHPEPVQDYMFPVTRVDQIRAPGYEENFDNLDIEVSFNEDLDANVVDVKRSYKGYTSEYYKAALPIVDAESKKEMLEEIVKYLAVDAEIENLDVVEANLSYKNWDELFVIKSQFTTKGYIQNAGNTLLFKAGELIGPQSEMYQERERKTEVVNDYNRGYLRKIKVNIPQGYSIQNPDDINLKEQVFEGDRLIYNFDSTYELEGEVLTITIEEWYDEIHYPIEKFQDFRRVINAAADWNKVVLVMKKS